MSTEHYYCCDTCKVAIHMGTRYAGGFKLHTIGPAKEKLEKFWNEHIWCEGSVGLTNEHAVTNLYPDEEASYKEVEVEN